MSNHKSSMIEKRCLALIQSFKPQMSWKWDDRFETVLAQFDVKDTEWVHKIIKKHMGNIWQGDNKSDAPKAIQPIITYFGDLEPGQRLYTETVDESLHISCAWWPWGNGQTISIRIGVSDDSLNEEENDKLSEDLKICFDL